MGVLALAVAGLAWLVFSAVGRQQGMRRLVEMPEAQVMAITDAAPALTLDGIRALPEQSWQAWTSPGYLKAGPGEVIWVRVRLANPGTEPRQGVLADTSYFSDRIAVWIEEGPGRTRHLISGGAVSGGDKALWGRLAAFPVLLPPGEGRLVYVRVSDGYLAHFQPVWWERMEDYYATQFQHLLFESLCFGALLALVLYNLVLWARLRLAETGYYVLMAGSSLAFNFMANGGSALLGVPLGSPGHETLMAFALGLGGICMTQFSRVFLGTAELLPRMDRGLCIWRRLLLGALLGVALMPWMDTPDWLSVLVLIAALTDVACMAAAIAAWRGGAPSAKFFVASYAALLVAAVPAVISVLRGDVIRGVAMAMLAGRTLEMLLLSFATADRFAHAQRRLVEETEQRRLIEETYADELEIEVGERTRELAEANADKDRMLAVIGHDLRGPLTGLMRAADATTGDLARETAHTGRALLLLIEDLVLWARLRAGTRTFAVHPARALITPAVALHRALAQHGGTELVIAVPEGLRVETDLVLTQTLVRNLLANGLKFARTRLVLRAEAVAGGVRFTVGNDGPPLPPAVAARFAAGEDEPLTATGGLGLRLCREICRALGMKLEAGSGAGGGTEFAFVVRAAGEKIS